MSKAMEHYAHENLDLLLKKFKKKKLIKAQQVRERLSYKKPSQVRKEQVNKAIKTQRYKVERGLV